MKTTKHAIKLLVPFMAKTPALQVLILIFAGVIYSGCTKKEFAAVPVSSILSVSDTVLRVGDTIRITGGNFSTTPGQNLVSIASVSLNVISATPTQLTAVIPASAQTGQLTVAYPGGAPARYPGKIHIVVNGQPIINFITPSSITGGDTVLLHGSGFGTPYSTNGLTIGGILVNLYNVSDSVVKAIVPSNALSGSVIITTNGLSSLPFPITIIQPNPLLDGRLYWAVSTRRDYYQTTPDAINLMRGNDQNTAPYCSILSPLGQTELSRPDYAGIFPDLIFDNGQQRFNVSNIVTDASGNGYYIYNMAAVGDPETYSLVKLAVKPSYARTVIWTHTFAAADVGATTFTEPVYGFSAPITNYPMLRLSIDDNKLYIKLGLSNNFYAGDVSLGTFNPTLQTYNIPDQFPYGLEFGKNYVFYGVIGGTDPYLVDGDPNYVTEIRYVPRGGGSVSKTIPIDLSQQQIETYMTDPTHNDNLLIYTITPFNGINFYGTIYKFNATTGVLTKLFDKSNWTDALSNVSFDGYDIGDLNLGFTWVNNHIYYINESRKLNNRNAVALYRLNDDGSSSKSTNIYPSIDLTSPNGATFGSIMQLFIDKTQAKP